ncbi:hypothetical protein EON67_01280, partial [archaeon]
RFLCLQLRSGPPSTSPAAAAWMRAAAQLQAEEAIAARGAGNETHDAFLLACGELDEEGACLWQRPSVPAYLRQTVLDAAGNAHPQASTLETEASWFTAMYGMYLRSTLGVEQHLIAHSAGSPSWTYIRERMSSGHFDDKMDHLVCFYAGVLALSSTIAPTPLLRDHQLTLARELAATCIHMYDQTATGLAAEITRFPSGGAPVPDPGAKHNLLRPETVESLFILYRVTGDALYRDAGWRIFNAFEQWSRVPSGGFSTLRDVTQAPPEQTDKQESFWLAETLKYFYLLFSDSDTIPLDRYVFNTEAHPLPVFTT